MRTLLHFSAIAICVLSLGCAAVKPSTSTASVVPAASKSTTEVSERYRLAVKIAVDFAEQEQIDPAETALTEVISDPEFEKLSDQNKRLVYSHAGRIAMQRDQYPQAIKLLLQAIIADPSDPQDGYHVAICQFSVGNFNQAANYLTMRARQWPDLVNDIDERLFWQIYRQPKLDADPKLQLMQSLFEANWYLHRQSASNLWYQLALMRLARALAQHGKQDPQHAMT
jgi:tetratricopeptide (TPR) repeat protein